MINDAGEAKKIVSCKVSKYDFSEKINQVKRIFPNMKDPDEKIIIDDCLPGEFLDSTNEDDIKLTLKWLEEFQNKTRSDWLEFEEIQKEVNKIKTKLSTYKSISRLPYKKWLEEYTQYIKDIKLQKTGVHGDFQIQNILIDRKRKSLNVIDWDWRFEEKGNPLYDFIWFMINLIGSSKNKDKEFSNLIKTDKVSDIIKLVMNYMNRSFGINLDFVILIRFMIVRFITFKEPEDPGINFYINVLKLMDN